MVAGGLSAAYALRLHLLAYGFTAAPGEGAQPAPAAYAAMAGLASFSLVLSRLWLPGAPEAVTKFFGTEIPMQPTLAKVWSLPVDGSGLLTGSYMVPPIPPPGPGCRYAAAAAWLGLPPPTAHAAH